MLLLSCGSSGGSGLNLGMLLGDKRRMLLCLMWVVLGLVLLLLLLLMLQPGGISLRILVLMRKDVLTLRLKHGGPTKD